MKKPILILFISALFINYSHGQTTGSAKTAEKKRWPSSERVDFIKECINSAKDAMSEDSARQYCYCMQEKVEAKYPSIDDAAKLSAEDLQTPEWKKQINDCLTSSLWSTKDREEFLEDCIDSAKEHLEEAKAKSYCECMLFKVEQRYPNPDNTSELTSEKLNSPQWKKIIQGCLDF